MDLNKWYEKGMAPNEYIESLEKLKEGFLNIYNNFTVPADEKFFHSLQEKNLRVIVLGEVWCGHCMLNIPILLRLSEKGDVPVRILPRDQNLDLMDRYLTNGKSRTIPIFIFIDENGNEVAKWGPIAPSTKQFVEQYRKELPPKDTDEYKEKFTEVIKITTKTFREDSTLWNGAYNSIKQALENQL